MIRSVVVAIGVLMSTSAFAGEFDGVYRLNKHWDCTSVGLDGGAVSVTGNKYRGVEEECTLSNPTRVRGIDAVLYDTICTGEGETRRDRLMYMKAYGGGLYIISRGSVVHWEKCN